MAEPGAMAKFRRIAAVPDVIGTPSGGTGPSLVPQEVVRHFAIASLASAFFSWLVR